MKALRLLLLLLLPTLVQAQSYTNSYGIWGYATNADGITLGITGYSGSGGALTIPTNIDGLTVTAIGNNAFYNCTNLTSLTIPNGVTSIGASACWACANLGSITLSGTLTSIGDDAFFDCASLTNATISFGVTSLGNDMFLECSSLTSITIPPSVTTIGENAFRYSGLASVTILGSVTNIGVEAFGGCLNLTNATFASGATTTGEYTFYGCSNLTTVTIPATVTTIGTGLFEYCTSLANLTLPNGITSIESEAFLNCTSLTNIIIPASVTNIYVFIPSNGADEAFSGCYNLVAISVVPSNSFYASLNGVLFDKSLTTLIEYPGGLSGNYTIPNGVLNIGDSAFFNCINLTSVTIPNSVNNIGFEAFNNCSSLTAITVAPDNPIYSSVNGVLFDISQTMLIQYPGGKAGSSYTIPNGVLSIGEFAFANNDCTNLTSVMVPNSVTSIGSFAFFLLGSSLNGVYFMGNSPSPNYDSTVFLGDFSTTVYYLPWTRGWGSFFDDRPTALWLAKGVADARNPASRSERRELTIQILFRITRLIHLGFIRRVGRNLLTFR